MNAMSEEKSVGIRACAANVVAFCVAFVDVVPSVASAVSFSSIKRG